MFVILIELHFEIFSQIVLRKHLEIIETATFFSIINRKYILRYRTC